MKITKFAAAAALILAFIAMSPASSFAQEDAGETYTITTAEIQGKVVTTKDTRVEVSESAAAGTEVTFEIKDLSAANEIESVKVETVREGDSEGQSGKEDSGDSAGSAATEDTASDTGTEGSESDAGTDESASGGETVECSRVESTDDDVIKYSFTMPEAAVAIKVTLSELEHIYGTWDGTVDVRWYNGHENDTVYKIYTPAELAGVAAIVNGKLDDYNGDSYSWTTEGFAAITDSKAETKPQKKHSEVVGAYEETKSSDSETSDYWISIDSMKGKTIILMSDMDMGGQKDSSGKYTIGPNYTPIGGQWCTDVNDGNTQLSTSFNGTLDGNGHTVKNISCRRFAGGSADYKMSQSIGLVGRLGCHDNDAESLRADNPTVKNVAVTGYISGRRSMGGIVGKIGKTNKGGIITNCANFAEIKGTDSKGTGGIVGSSWNGGIVKNCYNAGHVINKGVNSDQRAFVTGGISGSNECKIINCYNIGKVEAAAASFEMALGTQNCSTASFVKCYFKSGTAAGGGVFNYDKTVDNSGELSEDNMQSESFVSKLGAAFTADDGKEELNNGYPILKWQKEGKVPEVLSIKISGSPEQTEYIEGRHFKYDGITATAYYSDGSSEDIDEIYFSCDPDPMTYGTSSVKMTCSFEGKTAEKTFSGITVEKMELKDLYISSDARQKVYEKQDTFNTEGLEIRAVYTNDTSEILELDDEDLEIDTSRLMTLGAQRIEIKFTCNGKTRSVYQDIYVIESAPTAENNVYQLDSEGDLIWFADQVNNMGGQSLDAKLTADIALTREWTPIGTSETADGDYNYGRYTGTFDGAGHTVSGLKIDSTESYQGFFGYVGAAEIKDLTVSGSISAGTASAGIAGNVRGTAAKAAVISGCTSRVDVVSTGDNAAGIAGDVILERGGSVLIENCINRGSVSNAAAGGKGHAGGIAGSFDVKTGTGRIKDCINLGTVESSYEAGGIAGYYNGGSENCYSLAKVTAVTEKSGTETDTAGALFGYFGTKKTDSASNSGLYYIKGIAPDIVGSKGGSGEISAEELSEDYLEGLDAETITMDTFSYLYVSSLIKDLESIRESRVLTLDDKTLVKKIRSLYGKLSDDDKARITEDELAVLTAAEADMAALDKEAAIQENTPGKVSGIKAQSASYSSIKVSWSKTAGASAYEVYRSTSKSSGYSRIKTTSALYMTDTSLTCGKMYYYKVKACTAFTYSDEKLTSYGELSAAVSGMPVPAAVSSLKVSAGSKKATVSWKKVSGASGYQIYRSAKKSSGYKCVKTITKGSTVKYVNKSLTKKKTYYYKVRAYRTVGKSKIYGSFSSVKSVKVK